MLVVFILDRVLDRVYLFDQALSITWGHSRKLNAVAFVRHAASSVGVLHVVIAFTT